MSTVFVICVFLYIFFWWINALSNEAKAICGVILSIWFLGISGTFSKKEEIVLPKDEIHYVIKESYDGSVECVSELVKKDLLISELNSFKTREDCWVNDGFKEKSRIYNEKKIAERAESEKKAQERAKINQKRYKELIGKFRIKNDKVENVSFIQHKSNYHSPYGITSVRDNETRIYIGQSGSQKWLRFEAKYDAENWLFIESFILYADGETFSKELSREELHRGNYTSIWEIVQLPLEGELLYFIKKLIDSKDSIIRYKGKYPVDRKIGTREKQAIRETLELFDLM